MEINDLLGTTSCEKSRFSHVRRIFCFFRGEMSVGMTWINGGWEMMMTRCCIHPVLPPPSPGSLLCIIREGSASASVLTRLGCSIRIGEVVQMRREGCISLGGGGGGSPQQELKIGEVCCNSVQEKRRKRMKKTYGKPGNGAQQIWEYNDYY